VEHIRQCITLLKISEFIYFENNKDATQIEQCQTFDPYSKQLKMKTFGIYTKQGKCRNGTEVSESIR